MSALGLALLSACAAPPDGREAVDTTTEADTTPDPDMVRFLEQASFGPTPASVAAAQALGSTTKLAIKAWITAQQSPTATPPTWFTPTESPNVPLGDQLLHHALTANDQLRQRVAFALSEIFVVSNLKIKSEDGMVDYLNVLVNDAFGPYQTLLQDVTLNPAMGNYLDMAGNLYKNSSGTVLSPNENYAREVMQLFSLGLFQLDASTGQPVQPLTPTYNQSTIDDVSAVLTGWAYPNAAGCPALGGKNPVNMPYTVPPTDGTPFAQTPLLGCDVNHNPSAEELLDGYSTVAGWGTAASLENPVNPLKHTGGVMSVLATHPSVPGFICQQLIQRLTTSNPSPAYLQDVVGVFNASGGNLGKTVTEILSYAGATGPRGATAPDATFGHLREPVLLISGLLRDFTAPVSGGGVYGVGWANSVAHVESNTAEAMNQRPYYSPSVFNFFSPQQALPDYTPPQGQSALLAPEFGILDTNSVVIRANFVNTLIYGTEPTNMTLDLSNLAADGTPAAIITWLNNYLLHGTMSAGLQGVLTTALSARGLTATQMQQRGIYLVTTSAEYQIER